MCGRARHVGKRFCSTTCFGTWWRGESARRRAARPVPSTSAIVTECRTKYTAAMAVHVTGGGAQ